MSATAPSGSYTRLAVVLASALVLGHFALLAFCPYPLAGFAYHLFTVGAAVACTVWAAARSSSFGRRFWMWIAAGFAVIWIAVVERLWNHAHHVSEFSLAENFLFLVHMLPFAVALLLHDREEDAPLAALPNLLDYLQIAIIGLMLFAGFAWIPGLSNDPAQIRAAHLNTSAVYITRNILVTAGFCLRFALAKTVRERNAFRSMSIYLVIYSAGSAIGHYFFNHYQAAPRWIELEGTIPFAAAIILTALWREVPNHRLPLAAPERQLLVLHAIPATLPLSVGLFALSVGERLPELAWATVTASCAIFGFRLLATIYSEFNADRRRSAAESNYQSLFEGNLAAVFLCTDEGRFLDCNEAFLRMFNFASRRELAGHDIREVVFRDEERDSTLDRLRNERRLRNFETKLRRNDGTDIWVLQNLTLRSDGGTSTIIEGTVIDITEQSRAATAISDWRNRYEAAVEATGMAIYEWLPESCSATFGGNAHGICGYTADNLNQLQPNWFELVLETDRDLYLRHLKDGLASGRPIDFEYRITHRDGSLRYIREQGRAIFTADGRVSRVVGLVADITDRRQLEEHLVRAQKMEAVGRLSDGIAHDFNNMLTVIRGYTEILRERLHDQPPLLHSVLEIESSAGQAANLTRQLLAFSRQQALEPRIVDINQIVRNMDSVLHRLCGRDIDVKLQLDNLLGNIRIDSAQFQQIVLNLVSNARDAMSAGTIVIETRNTELSGPGLGTGLEITPGQYVMLAVHDTGVGMDAETKSHIFEPFFTTKEFGKGTGLGLASVYGVVRQSGGHVWVYSELGKGSSFKLYFPRIGGRSESMPSTRMRVQSFQGTETIAIAEDEASLRDLAAAILARCGYSVVNVPSLDDLDRLAATVKVDLLLTDLVMPAGTGRQFADRCRQLWPQVGVLFMSGYPETLLVQQGSIDPGSNFLQKPFTQTTLCQKVREVLNSRPKADSTTA
jgi:PAS domain S-box-containing protein